jgi:hypothetical protein
MRSCRSSFSNHISNLPMVKISSLSKMQASSFVRRACDYLFSILLRDTAHAFECAILSSIGGWVLNNFNNPPPVGLLNMGGGCAMVFLMQYQAFSVLPQILDAFAPPSSAEYSLERDMVICIALLQ